MRLLRKFGVAFGALLPVCAAAQIITPAATHAAAGDQASVDCAVTGTLIANDDGSSGSIALPFEADFYGAHYNSLFVNNNGNVTFANSLSQFTPSQISSGSTPIIAPFFADVDTRGVGSGLVSYGTTTFGSRQAFCVDWFDVTAASATSGRTPTSSTPSSCCWSTAPTSERATSTSCSTTTG